MSSPPPNDQSDDLLKNRKELNGWFSNPMNMQGANPVAYHIIWTMSNKMEADGNGLTSAHASALKNSLSSGKPICQVLREENPHVVSGSGKGFVYSLGRMFHEGVKYTNSPSGSPPKPPEKD